MIATALAALNWLRSTTVGRYVAVIGSAVLAVFLFWAMARRAGRKDAEAKLRTAAERAAVNRRIKRDAIDTDTLRAGSADRLRNDWSRD